MSNYPKRIYVLPAQQRAPALPRAIPSGHVAVSQRAPKRSIPTEQIVAELLGDHMGPSGPRKRERLTHLTQEEKMDRRKMKNRMAAQNARDKKKERSGKIEEVMHDLVEENRRLRAENEALRRQNEELLSQQNIQLTPSYTPEPQNCDENIYSNVVYEEEVVEEEQHAVDEVHRHCGDEDQLAFESAVFINAPLPWDKDNRSNTSKNDNSVNSNAASHNNHKRSDTFSKKINVDTVLTLITLLCSHMDQVKAMSHTSSESSNILSPSGEFDQFVADYIEEGSHQFAPSSSSGSFYSSPSEAREALSPGSLALSPSMSSNSDWINDNDDFFANGGVSSNNDQMTSTEDDTSLIDPGNWNFENFDENSIDLEFFENDRFIV